MTHPHHPTLAAVQLSRSQYSQAHCDHLNMVVADSNVATCHDCAATITLEPSSAHTSARCLDTYDQHGDAAMLHLAFSNKHTRSREQISFQDHSLIQWQVHPPTYTFHAPPPWHLNPPTRMSAAPNGFAPEKLPSIDPREPDPLPALHALITQFAVRGNTDYSDPTSTLATIITLHPEVLQIARDTAALASRDPSMLEAQKRALNTTAHQHASAIHPARLTHIINNLVAVNATQDQQQV